MLEPPNQDREDYADGPPPPWSPESPFQLIGYAVLAVLAGPSVLMRAVYGPRS